MTASYIEAIRATPDEHRSLNDQIILALVAEMDGLFEQLEAATRALNCEHNETGRQAMAPLGLWEYVQRDGRTWNRCSSCGALERWEGGQFFEARVESNPAEKRDA